MALQHLLGERNSTHNTLDEVVSSQSLAVFKMSAPVPNYYILYMYIYNVYIYVYIFVCIMYILCVYVYIYNVL